VTGTLACHAALLRAVGVALAVGAVSGPMGRVLVHARGAWSRLALVLLLAPLVTPSVLTGYAYAAFAVGLRSRPAGEALYLGLLTLRLAPVAALVVAFMPQPISPTGRYCWRLARPAARWRTRLGYRLRQAAPPRLLASGVCGLLAFSEFEMVSLLGVPSWTVALFDAQVQGMELADSLRLALAPAVVQLAVLGGLLLLLLRGRWREPAEPGSPPPPGPGAAAVGWAALVVGAGAVTVAPMGILFAEARAGVMGAVRDFGLGRDLAASLVYAAAGGGLGFLVAGRLLRCRRHGARPSARWALLAACAGPGLLGTLFVSLVVLGLFQAPGLRALYDTPLPLTIALAILSLPFAVLLRSAVEAPADKTGVRAAELLAEAPPATLRARGKALLWALRDRGRAWVLFLVFLWAYFDATAGTILAPPAMPTVFGKLYNFMHYGRSSLLSARVAAVVCAPLAVLIGAWVWRAVRWRRARVG